MSEPSQSSYTPAILTKEDLSFLRRLAERMGLYHATQRLSMESERNQGIFRRRRLEDMVPLARVLGISLKVTGRYGRRVRNGRELALTENHVSSAELPEGFDGFRILQLSDLHANQSEQISVMASLVAATDYDLCELTGDYQTGEWSDTGATIDAWLTS